MRWVVAVMVAGLLGCGQRTPAPAVATCVAGSTQACLCVGGASGVQACQRDGAWGACVCAAAPPAPVVEPGPTPALPVPVAAPTPAPEPSCGLIGLACCPGVQPCIGALSCVRGACGMPQAQRAATRPERPCGTWTARCCPGGLCNDGFECVGGMCSVPSPAPAAAPHADSCARHTDCRSCAGSAGCAWCPGYTLCRSQGAIQTAQCSTGWYTSSEACSY